MWHSPYEYNGYNYGQKKKTWDRNTYMVAAAWIAKAAMTVPTIRPVFFGAYLRVMIQAVQWTSEITEVNYFKNQQIVE